MGTQPSPRKLECICHSHGLSVKNIETVRKNVYTGTVHSDRLGAGNKAYIKLYSRNLQENLKQFTEIATEVGHPECVLIEDEITALVMSTATGRSLSITLPLALFPGIWAVVGETYISAYRQVGKQLGRLHRKTQSRQGPVLTADERDRGLDLIRPVDDKLSEPNKLQQLFTAGTQIETPYAITYGDRAPHNIYFDGQEVMQIDCGCRRRTVSYDHVGVIMGIRLMCQRLPYVRSSVAEIIEGAYRVGYGQIRPNSFRQPDPFKIRYVYRCLKLFEHYMSAQKPLNSKLTKLIDIPILTKEVNEIVSSITRP